MAHPVSRPHIRYVVIDNDPEIIEWREIKGFSQYQINNHGEIRTVESRVPLSKFAMLDTTAPVISLWSDDHDYRTKKVSHLMHEAFPTYYPEMEWRDIPGFPHYLINTDRDIRDDEGEDIRVRRTPEGDAIVSVWVEGRRTNMLVAYLYAAAFPERVEDDFDEKAKLIDAVAEELADNLDIQVEVRSDYAIAAKAIVNRIYQEGWRPSDE